MSCWAWIILSARHRQLAEELAEYGRQNLVVSQGLHTHCGGTHWPWILTSAVIALLERPGPGMDLGQEQWINQYIPRYASHHVHELWFWDELG